MSEQTQIEALAETNGSATAAPVEVTVRVPLGELEDGQRVGGVYAVRERELRRKRNGEPWLRLSVGDASGTAEAVCWEEAEALYALCCHRLRRSSSPAPSRSASAGGRRSSSPRCARPSRTSTRRPTWRRSPRSRWSSSRPTCASCWRRSRTRSCASCSTTSSARRRRPGSASATRRRRRSTTRPTATGCSSTRSRSPRRSPPPPTSSPASTATSPSPARSCTTSASPSPTTTTRWRSTSPTPAACRARSRSATTRCAARSRTSPASTPHLAQCVLHIILSHHGSLEHGSPVVPATREAVLVHMIDNLGGRLGSFDRLERQLPAGESWSGFDRALSGSRLLRPARGLKTKHCCRQSVTLCSWR